MVCLEKLEGADALEVFTLETLPGRLIAHHADNRSTPERGMQRMQSRNSLFGRYKKTLFMSRSARLVERRTPIGKPSGGLDA